MEELQLSNKKCFSFSIIQMSVVVCVCVFGHVRVMYWGSAVATLGSCIGVVQWPLLASGRATSQANLNHLRAIQNSPPLSWSGGLDGEKVKPTPRVI